MSNDLDKILSVEPKKLPSIDEEIKDDSSIIAESKCSECKHCLVVDKDGFYCSSGKVRKIDKDPISGLEARVFIPSEKGFEPQIFSMSDLPFPACVEEQNAGVSFELSAYLSALEKQK